MLDMAGQEVPSKPLVMETAAVFRPLLQPSRYKGAHGGRGSGKSYFFADLAIEMAAFYPEKIVCLRETQKSLEESVKALIEERIEHYELGQYFRILKSHIEGTISGSRIIFQGMQNHTAESIKSLQGYTKAWIEEGQSFSQRSVDLLRPTIRTPNSEIWAGWNPEFDTDPIDKLLRAGGVDPASMIVVEANYTDNPWFPDVLRDEVKMDYARDPEKADWVWGGGYKSISDAQVFKGKYVIDSFEPGSNWDGPYQGVDFGFANDPTTAVRLWITPNRLFIEYDCGKAGLELDDTADYINRKIPGFDKYVCRADNARPESISHLRRHGLPKIQAVKKWPGSIEDGISHMRSYETIVCHPRATGNSKELRLYSHKVEKKTGDVLPDLIDDHNHYIDADRYALAPIIRKIARPRVRSL